MVDEKVYNVLKVKGFDDRITEHEETIDTVEHAAQQIGCTEARIAKTLSFIVDMEYSCYGEDHQGKIQR